MLPALSQVTDGLCPITLGPPPLETAGGLQDIGGASLPLRIKPNPTPLGLWSLWQQSHLPGGRGVTRVKGRAGSCTVSRAAVASAAFPRWCPQVLSWHEVLVPALGKLSQTSSPGLSFLFCRQPDSAEPVRVLGIDRCGLESRLRTDWLSHLRERLISLELWFPGL